MMPEVADFFITSQNSDGGWGYKIGGMSYVEPTAAVLLAIAGKSSTAAAGSRGVDFLISLQQGDGGWGIAAIDDESGWMTAWAVWALARDNKAAAERGAEWLLKTAGRGVTDPAEVAQVRQVFDMDATLSGWPWQVGDASWVFPSALSLMALNVTGHSAHPRAKEGILYLLDRAVPSGGWNIGNPFMVTGSPPATFANTCLSLISLGGFSVRADAVEKGYRWLANELSKFPSPTELAWAVWANHSGDRDSGASAQRLGALQLPDGSWDKNPFTTALATLALAALP